ncbi:MAG TPA: nucleoside-diphosphate sugar epimerase [Cryomorphaceae bacterium]|nr:nucleoside-diphosphate sugar epimerase [Owenweeksia sp.]MBF98576.1 nucleoside-diphosphate sugar epimerase [Owenweeksia sp.]HAD96609.1 nucleoside-diphosphate sugar epimerase [Cryomorphaceae bacterium]HBF19103.1 nucleoside-diphosphate sugar epimerase [Cryomorphaceae bacterium]|tara:strand:+ start:12568 stop:13224 length:657 start_codon:yes stop_codon:yes gene_type:complete
MSKTAVVIGATGLIGNALLKQLLADERYARIIVLARRNTGLESEKLEELTGDLLDQDFWKSIPRVQAEDVFCCIGTTRAKTSDMQEYKNIDYGIPLQAAHWGLKNGLQKFVVISSIGADKNSRVFYTRTKGQMEEALRKLSIPRLYILRPSVLMGHRNEFRFGEAVGKILTKAFSWLLPGRYKGIKGQTVAQAMIILANSTSGQAVYESEEIRSLVEG